MLTQNTINSRVAKLAEKISSDYQGKELIIICVLKGAFIFCADLVRQIKVPHQIDFVELRSYKGELSTGKVRFIKDISLDIRGKHILIVEDIIDTGITLDWLVGRLLLREPDSLAICTLLNKPSKRVISNIAVKYIGFSIPDKFVIGYGLDYNENWRHLPSIEDYNLVLEALEEERSRDYTE